MRRSFHRRSSSDVTSRFSGSDASYYGRVVASNESARPSSISYAFEVSLWPEDGVKLDASCMGRKRWSLEEKRRIVELTLVPGASVARIAQAEGVNANQVFLWRRAFKSGELAEPVVPTTALLPVTVSAPCEEEIREPAAKQQHATVGAIHIELPGRAMISVERGADLTLVRSILESLRK